MDVDPWAWSRACMDLSSLIDSYGLSRVLGFDEVEKPEETSPGFPVMLQYSESWKVYRDYPWLVHEVWEDLSCGLSYWWYVFLKQEQLRSTKVDNEDIRAIYCQPDPVARCQARFDQDLNRKIKKDGLRSGIAVGMNPFVDTDALVRHLKEPNYYVERDWKRYDGTIPAAVLYLVRYLRWQNLRGEYKTQENWNVYSTITHNLIHKNLVHPTGETYHVRKGNPSGQMSTSIDNCLVNIFVTSYVHYVVYGKPYFSLCVYGDDTLLGYTNEPKVEAEAEVAMRTFGMSLPSESVRVSDTPSGLTFCGYVIGYKAGRWIPLYKPDRILANLWRPVNNQKKEDEGMLYSQLVSATLLLWETKYRSVAYDLLKKHFGDSEEYEVPDPGFFHDIFWNWSEVDQFMKWLEAFDQNATQTE